MPGKQQGKQKLASRQPLQERSRYKVQLILEATQRLLDKGGLEALTTNAIAASAGVSIGTLYQFFSSKEAILDALADHEVEAIAARVAAAMKDPSILSPEGRIAAVVRAVAAGYGGRQTAHRLVMAHSLTQGVNRLAPLMTMMTAYLSEDRNVGTIKHALGRADAFVVAHAFAGVLRAMISHTDEAPPQEEIASALARLVVRFIARGQSEEGSGAAGED